MRQIKDVLRLKLELNHSHQHIAASLGISKGVVAKYVKLASTTGLQWAQIQTMDETALHSRLMGAPQRASSFVAPDYARLHQELQRKGIRRSISGCPDWGRSCASVTAMAPLASG